jgi:hypothetical protein
MVCDFDEHLTHDYQKFGGDRAVPLYWARTLRSLWPLLKWAIGKALKSSAGPLGHRKTSS